MYAVAQLVRPYELADGRVSALGHHVVVLRHPHGEAYGVCVIDRVLRLAYAPNYLIDDEAYLAGNAHGSALAEIIDWTDFEEAVARMLALAPAAAHSARPQPDLRLVTG